MNEKRFERVPQIELADSKSTGDHAMEYTFEVSVGDSTPPILLVLHVSSDQVEARASFVERKANG